MRHILDVGYKILVDSETVMRRGKAYEGIKDLYWAEYTSISLNAFFHLMIGPIRIVLGHCYVRAVHMDDPSQAQSGPV